MQANEDKHRYEQLAEKWMNGTITTEEKQEYHEWFSQFSGKQLEVPASFAASEDILQNRMLEKIRPARRTHSLRWIAAAAAVLVLLGSGYLYYLLQSPSQTSSTLVQHAAPEIAPGSTGAVLTLANGEKVVLDSLDNGPVARQNGAQVVLQNGQLAYQPSTNDPLIVSYNSLITPEGRQFNLLLPDGTKVWLNAASSLEYPTAFTGKERKVKVTGEVYFEVAKNAAMPFKVNVNGRADIEVLGTSFNVNAYGNADAIKTTLLEGAVKIRPAKEKGQWALLRPGQQAVGNTGTSFRIDDAPNLEQVMAWKNGLFNFEDVSLQEAMQQLARWYNIEVIYEKGIPDIEFWGKIKKSNTLNQVLTALEGAKVHFRIEEGRKLIVLP